MFWSNLKAILVNLPLILSDTTDPKDISFTRVACALLLLFVTVTVSFVLIKMPQNFASISPFVTQALNSILMLIGGNIVKRGIDTAGSALTTKYNNINPPPPLPPQKNI